MGGSRSFFIESKFFQLVVKEGGRYFFLRIFEWGKYFMELVFMGKNVAQWLMKNIEHIVVGISPNQFFTFREGDIAYTLQRSSNSFGQFLLLTEFKVGGSRRSIIIHEGKAKNGWRVFGLELKKMLEPEHYVDGGSGHSKFVAHPHKDNSGIQTSKTFVETVHGYQVQVRGRNQLHLFSIHDKGKSQLREDRVVKQNPEVEQMVLSEIPAGKPCPTALGGGDVGSRCINVDFKLGEINLGGNKKRFPLRFIPNSNESVYGKECDLRNSCWTGKGLTVEMNGEGKKCVTWDCTFKGFEIFEPCRSNSTISDQLSESKSSTTTLRHSDCTSKGLKEYPE